MTCQHVNGTKLDGEELEAIEKMLLGAQCVMRNRPAKIVVKAGFKAAVKDAKLTGNYQLLSLLCEFEW